MSNLLMLDTVDVSTLSGLHFDALAGYVGGSWPTFAPECQHYPDLAKQGKIMSYAVSVDEDAEAADCEAGDMTVDECVNIWLPRQFKRGVKQPAVYANLDRWEHEGLRSRLEHYHDQIRRIVAWYTYKEGIDGSIQAWASGQQFTDHWASRNVDGNSVVDTFFHSTQPPHQNPVNYDAFPKGELPTHWGKLSERGVVERYDQARVHASQHQHEIHIYEAQLAWFAARVKCEAVYGDPQPNGHPNWAKYKRGYRYLQLSKRSHGVQFVK